jgi:predicted O-methyltransferase YrrM
MTEIPIAGQLNERERQILIAAICAAPKKPQVVLEVGTWLGGGSTLHFLRALERNGAGHLWGIEADRSIYDRMIDNIRAAAPEALPRFTPLFGLSQKVIPAWLTERGVKATVDVVFLDGGDNPFEQIVEFKLLVDKIPVGGRLLAHDTKLRKGKWLRPYLSLLDNWQLQIHDISAEGLLEAEKLRDQPGKESLRAAEKKLFFLRLDPVEVTGSLLPQKACKMILNALPKKLTLRISQGRK